MTLPESSDVSDPMTALDALADYGTASERQERRAQARENLGQTQMDAQNVCVRQVGRWWARCPKTDDPG